MSKQDQTDRHRDAMAKTARTLYDQSKKSGRPTTYSENLKRVQSADRNRQDK
jgi:hypothetical protein